MANIAVIGLGEAGSIYAAAFAAAGHSVWGIDPGDVPTPPRVSRTLEPPLHVINAVFVLTTAFAAHGLSETLLPRLPAESLWVDMSTASPTQKAETAQRFPNLKYTDIAILGPVLVYGTSTPLLASGGSVTEVADLLGHVGAPVETVAEGSPGDAMAHKLLRSILMKGLASVITEAVTAGAAAGREQWIREQCAAQLAGSGSAIVDRFLTGSLTHASRRAEEMKSVVHFLQDLGVPSDMSAASAEQLQRFTQR